MMISVIVHDDGHVSEFHVLFDALEEGDEALSCGFLCHLVPQLAISFIGNCP